MMARRKPVSAFDGSNSARYEVVRGYFYPLVLTFEQDLQKIATKLFANKLISSTDLDNASNLSQTEYERSLALLKKVMKRIEYDQKNFEVFVALLREFCEFSDIADKLESSLKKETHASPVLKKHRSQSQVYPRHFSDGILDAIRRHSCAWPEEDCGFFEDMHATKQLFCRESVQESTSVNKQLMTELSDLKKTIEQLEAEKESCALKLERQGRLISQRDKEIEDLKRKRAERDKVFSDLSKDKAEREKSICDLIAQCAGAKKDLLSAHKVYQDCIVRLQKDLDIVRASEKEARSDLAKAEASLSEAKLSKERELSKLREDFYKLKEIKNELEFQQRISQEEFKAESALKDLRLAQEARHYAVILATKEKEFAELKAQEDRRRLERQIQELQEQLKSNKLDT